jgi:ABC-type sugar transport system ATPase subunit
MMGEPKLVVAKNGDEGPTLSTHIVMVVDLPVPDEHSGEHQGLAIEAAYDALARRAKAEDSFILNVVQTVNVYQVLHVAENLFHSRLLVTITAQRIGREDLEKQQRLQRMQGGGR